MVKPQKIDLSTNGDSIDEDANMVVERLKRDGLYKPDLMYHGFDGERYILKIMLKHGTDTPDSDMINCGDETELRTSGSECCNMNALEQAYRHSDLNPALAIYDASKLMGGDCVQRKRFIDPQNKLDALVAVYLLPKADLI